MISKELKAAYRFHCKCKYYGILFAYLCDFCVKVYVIYMVGGVWVAFIGAMIDFIAKWAMLKNVKFRKKGFYKKRKKKRRKNDKQRKRHD